MIIEVWHSLYNTLWLLNVSQYSCRVGAYWAICWFSFDFVISYIDYLNNIWMDQEREILMLILFLNFWRSLHLHQ